MSRDKFLTDLKRMIQVLHSSDQNTTGQSQTASGSGTVIEKSKLLELIALAEGQSQTASGSGTVIEKSKLLELISHAEGQSQAASGSGTVIEKSKLLELISLAEKMQADASALPSTDKQAQRTGIFGSLPLSPFLRFRKNVMWLIGSRRRNFQVYLAVDTPEGVDSALIKLCNDMSYECDISKQIRTLQQDVPLIVVCPVISRLETDIDHALNGLDWQSSFIVLLLHQGNEDSLPGLPTATRLPEKPKYENAIFVDMAYSLEFYACKMNEDAKQEIKAFVEK